MQQKFFKEQSPLSTAKEADAAPDLNQDIINNLASHVSYRHGLAALGQTSKTMYSLVTNSYPGQLARLTKRDASRHGKYYEKLVATPLTFMSVPFALVPATIGITAGCIGCCLSPLAHNKIADAIELSGDLIFHSGRIVYHAPKKTRQILLRDINRERQEILDNQNNILGELSKPAPPQF